MTTTQFPSPIYVILSSLRSLLLAGAVLFFTSGSVNAQNLIVGTVAGGLNGSGTVGTYTLSGTPVSPNLITGQSYPVDLAVTPTHIYVVNRGANSIGKYNIDGTVVNAAFITGLNDPQAIAIQGSDIYVTDTYNNRIGKYTTAGATVNAAFITLTGPAAGVAVSGNDLYIAVGPPLGSGLLSKVQKFTTAGVLVNDSLLIGLVQPGKMVVSGSDLFLIHGSTLSVGKYDTTTGAGGILLQGGIGGTLINVPVNMVISGSDLYVASLGGDSIPSKIGHYTTAGATANADLITGLNGPYAIGIVNPVETCIFVSYGNGTIRQFDTAGTPTTFATGLSTPKGMAISAGSLYVANTGTNTILKFPTSGGSSTPFSSAGLSGPTGIAFNSAGDLCVANYTSSTIQRLNGSGGAAVPPFPVTSANMNGTYDLAFDAAGNIYASSHNNNTIQKFTASGVFISDFVSFGGGLSAPRGMVIRAGVLYVANYITSVVTMFDVTNGGNLGNYATAADGLLNPVGIAFDNAGNLYVTNAGNHNILKFTAPHVGTLFSNIFGQSPDFIAICCKSMVPTVTINLYPGLIIQGMYPGLTIQGSIGCQYRIETSTDLINWTPLTTFTLPTSPYLYLDTTPATVNRFYRVVQVN